ncbi:MAG: bifunctional proline dehydrogenase/L-glutamate gamma-semialdehyde dehydrogenase, partial [Chlamydiia bacterium]|nr:bifunctional proline dehydrogenase/L-glutamate gamma-semialdehyde dehydrogenase [Chlamydiia bacterium]
MDLKKEVKELFGRAENEDPGVLAPELAEKLLVAANADESYREKKQYQELSRMMEDEKGKIFLTALTDQCFRSLKSSRVADQICYLIDKYGIPKYPDAYKRLGLKVFRWFGKWLPGLFVPLTKSFVRHETSNLILPGEREKLSRHMERRRKEGVRINLNHLGEAILGEKEAKRRLDIYMDDLINPSVEYISVKISTIYSQISLTAREKTLTALSERFRNLLRAAKAHPFKTHEGKEVPKFVNLDMEEYRDLALTVELFIRVLSEPEFLNHSAGIVLQAYLPDSFGYQKRLTEWAIDRKKKGGAPVKIRIVKGANLAMEKVEGSIRGWPQAPFEDKSHVDANFKKMVDYAFIPEHADAVHIGVGSHNLFDIAYALILMHKNGIQGKVAFEMLEGMADPMRRAVQSVVEEMLLYCPAAKKEEFQNAVAYLVRRLDENTAPENFLRHAFGLKPDTPLWAVEKNKFFNALQDKKLLETYSRRTQDRLQPTQKLSGCCRFTNEPDTDFSLPQNQKWISEILEKAKREKVPKTPLVIGGKERGLEKATKEEVELSLSTAESAFLAFKSWPYTKRANLLRRIADNFRQHRGDLIQAMAMEASKTVQEADVEVSEAI